MLGTIVTTLILKMQEGLKRPLNIVETGTIRDIKCLDPLREERSTLCIALALRDEDTFHSVDINAQHVSISSNVLSEAGFGNRVIYHLGNSHDVLGKMKEPIDFALLDSDSDAEVIAREFELVRPLMASDGIVVIDDAFKPVAVNKARLVIERGTEHYNLSRQAIGIPFGPVARRILQAAGQSL